MQGDIIAILDSNGAVAAEYEYDAWGNCTVTKDTDTIAYLNPLRYRGYYYDSDTGLYYLQSRYYDPQIGRFINADDAEMVSQGVYNLFSYCENNPVNRADANGMWYYSIVPLNRISIFSPRYLFNLLALNNRKHNNEKFADFIKSKLPPDEYIVPVATLLSNLPYIYGQGSEYIADMRYGIASLKKVGCEIIATYNLLIAIGRSAMLNAIIAEFEINNMFYGGIRASGILGTDPDDLYRYFDAHNIVYFKTKSMDTLKKSYLAKEKKGNFIVGYWTGSRYRSTIHTVYVKKNKNSNYVSVYNLYSNSKKASFMKVSEFYKKINEDGRFITAYKF